VVDQYSLPLSTQAVIAKKWLALNQNNMSEWCDISINAREHPRVMKNEQSRDTGNIGYTRLTERFLGL
jgi:hypothetical protein